MSDFGKFLRKKRLSLGKGLRTFCLEHNLDPSNYSKIERGKAKPPSREKLEEYANFLNIKRDSDEWLNFFDLATVARRCIPEYVYENEKFVSALPLLFRKAETGEHYTKEELLQLVEDIKKSK